MDLKEYEPTNLGEVELALDCWRMGDPPSKVTRDDEPEVLPDVEMADGMYDNFGAHEYDTLKLLELWIGYVQASEDEGTEVTVEDFVLATYEVLRTQ